MERASSRTTLLTDGQSRHTNLLLSRDGRRLAWASDARPGSESDVYVAAIDAPAAPRRLTGLAGRWRPLDFSANGQALLVLHQRAPGDDELWLAPVDGSAQKKLWPPEGAARIADARYSADGHELFLVSDFFSDAQELLRLELDHPERPAQRLTAALKWDVDALACAQDRGAPAAAAIAVNQGGYDRLYLLEPGTLRLMPVSLPSGLVTALRFPTVKSDVLMLGLESPTRPGEIEQLDVRTRRLVRWTRAELGPLDPAALLEPERASWSSDGLSIPALVYRPRIEAGARAPVLLVLRAGPRSLARPGFDALAQLAANELGVAVLAPSLRGAAALGKALRGDPDPARLVQQRVRDLAAGIDWIQRQPDLDPSRVILLDEAPESGLAAAFERAHPKRLRAALGADLRDREANRSGSGRPWRSCSSRCRRIFRREPLDKKSRARALQDMTGEPWPPRPAQRPTAAKTSRRSTTSSRRASMPSRTACWAAAPKPKSACRISSSPCCARAPSGCGILICAPISSLRSGGRCRSAAAPRAAGSDSTPSSPAATSRASRAQAGSISQALARALETLPLEQREVLALKIDGQLTFAEIADQMGTSLNTAASRYRYALAKLKELLGETP